MIEIAEMAQQAIDALRPMLHGMEPTAAKAMGGFAGQVGGKLFTWLSEQVKGKPAETTLERAVAEPDNARRTEALRLEIEELAERDEAFRRGLSELLKGVAGTAGTQTVSADHGAKVVQNFGKGNNIRIG